MKDKSTNVKNFSLVFGVEQKDLKVLRDSHYIIPHFLLEALPIMAVFRVIGLERIESLAVECEMKPMGNGPCHMLPTNFYYI